MSDGSVHISTTWDVVAGEHRIDTTTERNVADVTAPTRDDFNQALVDRMPNTEIFVMHDGEKEAVRLPMGPN